MIKVVAFDLDGTMLNSRHEAPIENIKAVRRGIEKGLRFIVITGRTFQDTMTVIGEHGLELDYIVGSGAEIRNREKHILKQVPMVQEEIPKIIDVIKKYPVAIRFCTDTYDYMLGTREEIKEYLLTEYKFFHTVKSREETLQSDEFRWRFEKMKQLNSLHELAQRDIQVTKIMVFSESVSMITDIDKELVIFDSIASASSFENNLELTNIDAQKGPALKEYIENLGYSMDEVMVIGDSMNDYSMISMDFGATVAMENAMNRIKRAAKYITKNNDEFGVAHAISFALGECVLEKPDDLLI